MQHFTERKHLIRWIMQTCRRKSVVRAMDEGSVELLGAFKRLGPMEQPGFMVRVTSETGKVWCVEVVAGKNGYGIFILEDKIVRNPETKERYVVPFEIPWEDWLFDSVHEPFTNPVYIGDNPEEYRRLRDEQRKAKTV